MGRQRLEPGTPGGQETGPPHLIDKNSWRVKQKCLQLQYSVKSLFKPAVHRRRINTGENAKVVAAVLGTEFIKFLATALAVLH